MTELKTYLSGKKVYLLMLVGAVAAIAQYFVADLDFGIAALPPVADIGDLISQLWTTFPYLNRVRMLLLK